MKWTAGAVELFLPQMTQMDADSIGYGTSASGSRSTCSSIHPVPCCTVDQEVMVFVHSSAAICVICDLNPMINSGRGKLTQHRLRPLRGRSPVIGSHATCCDPSGVSPLMTQAMTPEGSQHVARRALTAIVHCRPRRGRSRCSSRHVIKQAPGRVPLLSAVWNGPFPLSTNFSLNTADPMIIPVASPCP
jgi:hypothetical protein